MPSTLTRVTDPVSRIGAPDITFPPAGIVSGFTGIPGDLVLLSSGAIDKAAATGATIASGVQAAVLNQFVNSGTATGTVVGIEKVGPHCYLELPIATSSGATIGAPAGVTTPATLLPTLVGSQFGISRATSGSIYYVNQAVTSSALLFEITGVGTQYPTSDTFPTVIGKIVTANVLP